MKRLINFLIINTMIGLDTSVLMTNVMTLSYLITNVYSPYLKQVRQPHPSMYDSLIRSDELYNRLKIITNLKKIDDVANLSRL